jgi:DNA polymerase-1
MAVDKARLFSLFENLKEEEELKKETTINSKILIVDGMNTFLRVWSMYPTQNDDGDHIGGYTGFLKSVGYAIRELKPTRCIIVFDGKGGSKRRKKLFPEYKNRSNPSTRVNRALSSTMTQDEEQKSMSMQMVRLVEYLNVLPVTTICIDNIEADDTIAYICTNCIGEDDHVSIMSADQDFYQLINEQVQVYSPTKKKIYDVTKVKDECLVHPHNFALFKTINGDRSDNIKGIKGLGDKKIPKLFPFLTESIAEPLEKIFEYAEDNINGDSNYQTVINKRDRLELNYKLMQLGDVDISEHTKRKISRLFDEEVESMNKMRFVKLFNRDKLYAAFQNYNKWLMETFTVLNNMAMIDSQNRKN